MKKNNLILGACRGDLWLEAQMPEYLRHKELIKNQYKKKMAALKEMYPQEWALDKEKIPDEKYRGS